MRDHEGAIPLHWAAANGHVDMVQHLVDAGFLLRGFSLSYHNRVLL